MLFRSPLGFLKQSIAGTLAKALGRRVEIDDVSLTLFPQPAFALSGVTISEDSRAGIEPFAYADALDAQVNVLGIFGASNKFSRIRLTGATLNLVKTDAAGASGDASGPWNVQYLLGSTASADEFGPTKFRIQRSRPPNWPSSFSTARLAAAK